MQLLNLHQGACVFVLVKSEQFKLLGGADAQAEYQWTPPGKPSPFLHYNFCNTCGVRSFGWGEHEQFGGKFYFVSIAALDDVNPEELAAASIRYSDGRDDRFGQPPADTRLL